MSFFVGLAGYLVTALVTLLVVVIVFFKWSYQYFARKNIPYLVPTIPFGNISEALKGKETVGITLKRRYEEMKEKGWKYGGLFLFSIPNLMVLDLDMIRNIMTKDFSHFVDRTVYCNEEDDPISAHLAALTGSRWKNLRAKLTPTFTSGKMRMMFETLASCQEHMHKRMIKGLNEPIDIKNVLACFTTDVIGSCAFGLDCKAIEEDDSPFRVYGRKAIAKSKFESFKDSFAGSFPKLAKFFHIITTKPEVSQFFMKIIKDTVEYREKNNIKRNDIMQMLIDLKNTTTGQGLTMNEVAAQSFVFFTGGFETSSTLMTFTLYELSRHQDIQEKLRREIKTTLKKHDGKITYEAIQEMKYITQVLEETLRLYAPAPLTNRVCQKDYKVPGENLIIEKGVVVIIPIMGIHHDPEYYPEPEKFNPERFSEESKASRHNYTYLPFGEGPRICIGMRFGLLQAKVGLTALLSRYKFTVNKKTIEPLQFQPSSILLSVVGDVWLNAENI